MFAHDEVQKLLNKQDVLLKPLKNGELKITPTCICESAAGHYIGLWCVEKDGDMLTPQPYDRFSGYMTKDEVKALPFYQ